MLDIDFYYAYKIYYFELEYQTLNNNTINLFQIVPLILIKNYNNLTPKKTTIMNFTKTRYFRNSIAFRIKIVNNCK